MNYTISSENHNKTLRSEGQHSEGFRHVCES